VLEVALTCISGGTLEVYIEPHLPRPQLIVVGHLPIAEALVALGKGLGYSVSVLGLDATPSRFPQADLVLDRLDFSQVRLTPQTFIVVATHGNYDEEALAWALQTEAAYVALVASRKRAESVIAYLRDAGLSDARLARLKYPAGLDIGAQTPEEIALSILAEIIQQRPRTALVAETAPPPPAEAIDPVCGMTVEIPTARYVAAYAGQTYYFCSAGCKRDFEKEPEKFVKQE